MLLYSHTFLPPLKEYTKQLFKWFPQKFTIPITKNVVCFNKYCKVADSLLLFPLSLFFPVSPLPYFLKSKIFFLPPIEYLNPFPHDLDPSSTSKFYKNSLTLIRISFQQQQKSVFLLSRIYEVERLKLHSSYAIPRESFFLKLKYNCSVLNKHMVSLGR